MLVPVADLYGNASCIGYCQKAPDMRHLKRHCEGLALQEAFGPFEGAMTALEASLMVAQLPFFSVL